MLQGCYEVCVREHVRNTGCTGGTRDNMPPFNPSEDGQLAHGNTSTKGNSHRARECGTHPACTGSRAQMVNWVTEGTAHPEG